MAAPGELEICLIGMGPRGLALLERLVTNSDRPLRIHLVDPYPPGGRVWRTDQSAQLLMNTVAAQVTVFPDQTVEMSGRQRPGPSLYEWAHHQVLFGLFDEYDEQTAQEIRTIGPDTYSTRRLVGVYLDWVYRHILRNAPETVAVVHHPTTAVAMWDERDGRQAVLLDTGDRLAGLDAVALAIGHYPVTPNQEEQRLANFAVANQLTYILPANPADVDLSMVRPGEPTLLRGLGLCFFDYLALLTTGRGGQFVRSGATLEYIPSGLEPQMFAGSRRGVPYQARGTNQKGPYGRHNPNLLTVEAVGDLRASGPLDFRSDLWPLIAKEVESVYYTTQLRQSKCDCVVDRFENEYLALPWRHRHEDGVLRMFGIDPLSRWDWEKITRPCDGLEFAGPADFQEWLCGYLESDMRQAAQGNVKGPAKAALDVLRDLRNEVRLAVDHCGLTGESHERDLDRWYSPMNAFLSIGPPAHRVDEMLALIRAGVLKLVGPGLRVDVDAATPAFVAESPQVSGSRSQVTAMIEARLHEVDLSRSADPMLRWLVNHGAVTSHAVANPDGTAYSSGGVSITPRPFHLRGTDGQGHPRRFVFGVPTEGAHWATAAGARPGVNSVMLGDSDAISHAILSLADVRRSEKAKS